MIEAPERYLRDFVAAGAHRVTVHQETCPHLHRTVEEIRELGALPGVAVNPSTPLAILHDILSYVDLVLVMTVNPGFGGQAFIPTSLGKVRAARALLNGMGKEAVPVQVDGGVSPDTIGPLVDAGAGVLVAGSAVFGHSSGAAAGVRELRAAISNHP
jgi:ribulose-phosphate 3-epimerase